MGDRNLRDTGLADWLRRLPHYLYVADLIAGKQVLEIGCGSGEGAKFLADHGAARVVGVDARSAKIEHARGNRANVHLWSFIFDSRPEHTPAGCERFANPPEQFFLFVCG